MVTCPTCGATNSADFGMVACAACDGVFMIEMDGTVTVPSLESEATSDETFSEAYGASEGGSAEEPAIDNEDNSYFPNEEAPAEEVEGFDSVSDDVTTESAPTEDAAPEEYSESFMDDLDNPSPPVIEAADDPLGVTRFDGSEASQMADGPFYYDLRITGIDTAQLKQQVIDMLSDRRLGWSPDEIRKQIKSGQIFLENLNPVRAVLAVLRMQTLDVDVEWDQRPFTTDSESAKDQEV